jgi:hypothetical protein
MLTYALQCTGFVAHEWVYLMVQVAASSLF